MWSTAPLPPLLLIASLLIVFGAGVVRGFAGFGFSALSVAGLALLVSPAKVVPAIFMLEVLASLSLLRSAARDIDWHWLGWLIAGHARGDLRSGDARSSAWCRRDSAATC